MKARVKATGEVFDFKEIKSYQRYKEAIIGTKNVFYTDDEIEILGEPSDNIDWQAYRREVAKECMASMMERGVAKNWGNDVAVFARWAVQSADALIAELKQTEQ